MRSINSAGPQNSCGRVKRRVLSLLFLAGARRVLGDNDATEDPLAENVGKLKSVPDESISDCDIPEQGS